MKFLLGVIIGGFLAMSANQVVAVPTPSYMVIPTDTNEQPPKGGYSGHGHGSVTAPTSSVYKTTGPIAQSIGTLTHNPLPSGYSVTATAGSGTGTGSPFPSSANGTYHSTVSSLRATSSESPEPASAESYGTATISSAVSGGLGTGYTYGTGYGTGTVSSGFPASSFNASAIYHYSLTSTHVTSTLLATESSGLVFPLETIAEVLPSSSAEATSTVSKTVTSLVTEIASVPSSTSDSIRGVTVSSTVNSVATEKASVPNYTSPPHLGLMHNVSEKVASVLTATAGPPSSTEHYHPTSTYTDCNIGDEGCWRQSQAQQETSSTGSRQTTSRNHFHPIPTGFIDKYKRDVITSDHPHDADGFPLNPGGAQPTVATQIGQGKGLITSDLTTFMTTGTVTWMTSITVSGSIVTVVPTTYTGAYDAIPFTVLNATIIGVTVTASDGNAPGGAQSSMATASTEDISGAPTPVISSADVTVTPIPAVSATFMSNSPGPISLSYGPITSTDSTFLSAEMPTVSHSTVTETASPTETTASATPKPSDNEGGSSQHAFSTGKQATFSLLLAIVGLFVFI